WLRPSCSFSFSSSLSACSGCWVFPKGEGSFQAGADNTRWQRGPGKLSGPLCCKRSRLPLEGGCFNIASYCGLLRCPGYAGKVFVSKGNMGYLEALSFKVGEDP